MGCVIRYFFRFFKRFLAKNISQHCYQLFISSLRNYSVKRLGKMKIKGDTLTLGAVFFADLSFGQSVAFGIRVSMLLGITTFMAYVTASRFGFSIFVGFTIYFSLSFTASANQFGYAGFKYLEIIEKTLFFLRSCSWDKKFFNFVDCDRLLALDEPTNQWSSLQFWSSSW